MHTHEYEAIWDSIWGANTCVISYYLEENGTPLVANTGSTSYMEITGTEPDIDTVLHEYTYLSSDFGEYTVTLVAFYSGYPELTVPTIPTQTFSHSFTLNVEPICELTSF